ncbi:MAG: linear amide C-N hydrolase, partial [Gemmobacter sp.]
MKAGKRILGICVAAIGLGPAISDACTRVLWNDNGYAVMVGRSMDWPESTEPVLTLLPRGMARDGGKAGPDTIVAENPAQWTSKYGSLITSIYGIGSADGINEAGLAMHMLYLNATDFGPRDTSKGGLQAGLW